MIWGENMSVNWTEQQLEAIETRGGNILVAAAAGSGKTAVLVERIIRMITDEKDPVSIDRLLVLTFTDAAAAEMKRRYRLRLTKSLKSFPITSGCGSKAFALVLPAYPPYIRSAEELLQIMLI